MSLNSQQIVEMYNNYFDRLANPPLVAKQGQEQMQQAIAGITLKQGPTETELQRRHLLEAIDNQYHDHKETLATKHGLTDEDPPKTWKEFLARIKAGDFRYDGKDEEKEHYDATSHIRWRKKDSKEDQAGYKAAKLELRKRYNRARDEIIILPLEQALQAKRDFETLH